MTGRWSRRGCVLIGWALGVSASAPAEIAPTSQSRFVHARAFSALPAGGEVGQDFTQTSPDFLPFNRSLQANASGSTQSSATQSSVIQPDRLQGTFSGSTRALSSTGLFQNAAAQSSYQVTFDLPEQTTLALTASVSLSGVTNAPGFPNGGSVEVRFLRGADLIWSVSAGMNEPPGTLDVTGVFAPGTYQMFALLDIASVMSSGGGDASASAMMSFDLVVVPGPSAAAALSCLALIASQRRRRAA